MSTQINLSSCNMTLFFCPQHTRMLWGVHASDAISQWMPRWRMLNATV